MRFLRCFIATTALSAAAGAHAGTYSDMWFDPRESGWGVNLVQQGERAFVTLFVYGADGKPVWYVSPDAHAVSYSAGGQPSFRGTLYRTRGPWHGGPYDPALVQPVYAGIVALELVTDDRMRLAYQADDATVTKELRRQSFEAVVPYSGYVAQFMMRAKPAGSSVPQSFRYTADLYAEFDGGTGWIRATDTIGRICHYRGPYSQAGKLITFSGSYACSGGDEGAFEIKRLEITQDGATGYLTKSSPAGTEYGRFAATRF